MLGDLTEEFDKKFTRKGGSGAIGPSYGAGQSTMPFVDSFNKTRAPSPWQLIQENLGTAYACGTLNGDLVAKTTLRLYVKTRRGETKSRFSMFGRTKGVPAQRMGMLQKFANANMRDATGVEEVTEHPVLDLLQKPLNVKDNSVAMDQYGQTALTQKCQEICGRAYWYVETKRMGRTPSSLWLLAPQFVQEWPGFGPGDPIISRYEYNAGRGMETYYPDELVIFRMYDPGTGGYMGGLSPLRACFEQVKLARNADALVNARVQNGGMPSALYMPSGTDMGGPIGEAEAARIQAVLRLAFARAGAGGIAVGEFPGSITPLSWPITEIIDGARYQLTRAQIAEAYQVPITKLDRKDANRASAESGDYAHALDAGVPRCKAFAAALNSFLLPFYDDSGRFFFAFDDPAGLVDTETEYKRITEGAKNGSILRNEYRSWVGLEELPWGNQPLIPTTMQSVGEDGKPDAKPVTAKPTEGTTPGANDRAAADGIDEPDAEAKEKRAKVRRVAMMQLGL